MLTMLKFDPKGPPREHSESRWACQSAGIVKSYLREGLLEFYSCSYSRCLEHNYSVKSCEMNKVIKHRSILQGSSFTPKD